MPDRPVTCQVKVTLTDAEYHRLDTLPEGDHQMRRELQCELHPRHDDLHCALGQQSGEDAWWLRWDDTGRRELLIHDPCPAEEILGNDAEPCFLMGGHSGRHSFERDA